MCGVRKYRILSTRPRHLRHDRGSGSPLTAATRRELNRERRTAPSRGSRLLEFDFEDLEFVGPGGNFDLDLVADFLAHEALSKWAGNVNFAAVVIFFSGAH